MKILNSLIVPTKCIRGTLFDFSTSIQLQNKIEEEPFGDIKNFREKSFTKSRKGRVKSHSDEKNRKEGTSSALEWFCISCKRLWMRSK